MSKLPYLIALVLSLSFVSCENDITTSEVPSIVENTFKSKFVQAKNVEWEFANDTYEASFDVENVDHDALLDSSGNLLKYKHRIDGTAVPKGIRAFLAQNHPKGKWDDAEYIVDGNSKYFQIELEGFFTDTKLVLDSSGKELSNIKYWN